MFILHGRRATAGHERKDGSWTSDEVRADPLKSHLGPVTIAAPQSLRERFRVLPREPETPAEPIVTKSRKGKR